MALRILIVEDEVIIGLLLADLLAGMGHQVCSIATNVSEAVTAATEHEPGLMIVDVNLGRENGVVAVDAICAVAHIPCIFVSGDNAVLAGLAHRGEVMAKPYHQRDVERAIGRAVGQSRGVASARP